MQADEISSRRNRKLQQTWDGVPNIQKRRMNIEAGNPTKPIRMEVPLLALLMDPYYRWTGSHDEYFARYPSSCRLLRFIKNAVGKLG